MPRKTDIEAGSTILWTSSTKRRVLPCGRAPKKRRKRTPDLEGLLEKLGRRFQTLRTWSQLITHRDRLPEEARRAFEELEGAISDEGPELDKVRGLSPSTLGWLPPLAPSSTHDYRDDGALWEALLTPAQETEALLISLSHGLSFSNPTVAMSTDLSTAQGYFHFPAPLFASPQAPACALRRRLAEATEEEYQAAKAIAEEARETWQLPLRAALSFLFPAEEAWAEEDGGEQPPRDWVGRYQWMLMTCQLPLERHEGWLLEVSDYPRPPFLELVELHGAAIGPALAKALERRMPTSPGEPVTDALIEALALIPSGATGRALVNLLDRRSATKTIQAFFRARPEVALEVLPPQSRRRGRRATLAKALLAELAGDHPELFKERSEAKSGASAEILDEALSEAAEAVAEVAPAEALPRALLDPPWRHRVGRKLPKPDQAICAAPRIAEATRWTEAELEEALALEPKEPLTEDQVRELDQELKSLLKNPSAAQGRRELAVDQLLQLPRETARSWWENYHGGFVLLTRPSGDFEPVALALQARTPDRPIAGAVRYRSTFAHLRTTEAALKAAERLSTPDWREEAERWLERNADIAAPVNLAVVVGKTTIRREPSLAALRLLCSRGQEAAVLEAATATGLPEAVALVEELRAEPYLPGVPWAISKLPKFLEVERLPPPKLRGDGRALPQAAITTILRMLTFSDHHHTFPDLCQVRELCDPESLDRFAWAVFSAWRLAGRPTAGRFALFGLGHLGGERAARELMPLYRSWASKGDKEAILVPIVLATMGNHLSLMHLVRLAESERRSKLRERAQQQLALVAQERGQSVEDLADEAVPTLGLEQGAKLVLDFGARRFIGGFAHDGTPRVSDEAGRPLKSLPKGGKRDDKDKAREANQRWREICEDARQVWSRQATRLERTLITGRPMEARAFSTSFARHPLLNKMAATLLWTGVNDRGEPTGPTFTVDEEGEAVDLDDAPLELPDLVTLAHPAELDAALVGLWGNYFADFERIPPFPQLQRPVYRLNDSDERTPGKLGWTEGRALCEEALRQLTKRWYYRGWLLDWGGGSLHHQLSGATLRVTVSPGLRAHSQPPPPQLRCQLGALALESSSAIRFSDLPPRPLSEALHALLG